MTATLSQADVYRLRNIGKGGGGGSGSLHIHDYENGVQIDGHTLFNPTHGTTDPIVAEFDGDVQINYKVTSPEGKIETEKHPKLIDVCENVGKLEPFAKKLDSNGNIISDIDLKGDLKFIDKKSASSAKLAYSHVNDILYMTYCFQYIDANNWKMLKNLTLKDNQWIKFPCSVEFNSYYDENGKELHNPIKVKRTGTISTDDLGKFYLYSLYQYAEQREDLKKTFDKMQVLKDVN